MKIFMFPLLDDGTMGDNVAMDLDYFKCFIKETIGTFSP